MSLELFGRNRQSDPTQSGLTCTYIGPFSVSEIVYCVPFFLFSKNFDSTGTMEGQDKNATFKLPATTISSAKWALRSAPPTLPDRQGTNARRNARSDHAVTYICMARTRAHIALTCETRVYIRGRKICGTIHPPVAASAVTRGVQAPYPF